MNRPYIICHMMMSLDARIDCKMTESLKGTEDYYKTLDSFDTFTHVSGRVTAETELGCIGKYQYKEEDSINKETFYKDKDSKGYEIIMDTKGTLLWNNQENEEVPILVLTSEKANKKYLENLKNNHISYVVSGKNKIDLKRSVEILFKEFNVKKMVVVGGGHINASFLNEGLLDEISVLLGAGIDGRKGMISVFDGLNSNKEVTQLKLEDVKVFKSDAVWLKYKVQ